MTLRDGENRAEQTWQQVTATEITRAERETASVAKTDTKTWQRENSTGRETRWCTRCKAGDALQGGEHAARMDRGKILQQQKSDG
jgi:hypothetical protein